MTVEFTFEKGGVGALHSHPHVQASYIAEGLFEVTIDGKTETLGAGGSFIVPPTGAWRQGAGGRTPDRQLYAAPRRFPGLTTPDAAPTYSAGVGASVGASISAGGVSTGGLRRENSERSVT